MTSSSSTAKPLAAAAAAGQKRRLPRRKIFWLLLAGVLLVIGHALYEPAWHGALRTMLLWQARRCNCDLSIAAVDGSPFGSTELHGVHCRSRVAQSSRAPAATDIQIVRAKFTLAWTLPGARRVASSWIGNLMLEGVSGRWNLQEPALSADGVAPVSTGEGPAAGYVPFGRWFAHLTHPRVSSSWQHFLPETFLLRADDLWLVRGQFALHGVDARLTGALGEEGEFLSRQLTVIGPGFESTVLGTHGRTFWQPSKLTFHDLALGSAVNLVSATLDGSRLNRHRLIWDARVTALGGEIRSQGTVDLSHPRLALEVAASLQGTALAPFAQWLGVNGPTEGFVDSANFSFRGDPENWPAAQMWLAAHSTDFRWGKRHWQDLEVQAVIVNRRVQVHRLELRQDANRVSLAGECLLPLLPAPGVQTGLSLADWRAGGFTCQLDARLEDLRALADLAGSNGPGLEGRMSVNGSLSGLAGPHPAIEGYLNVEGTRLVLRGAPLDYLRSTLIFKDGNARVADLQATHDGDYFTGTGSLRIDGAPRYSGELRAEVRALDVYTPALSGLPLASALGRVTNLNALLTWDDSDLRIEQCEGKFAGASFALGGTARVTAGGAPVLDLALRGERLPLRSADGSGELQADCTLTLHSTVGDAALGGEIRVLQGLLRQSLRIESAASGDPEPLFDFRQWMPAASRKFAVDVHVTASAPILLAAGGDLWPDFWIRTTGTQPAEAGSGNGEIAVHGAHLEVGDADWRDVRGTVFFPDGFTRPLAASLLATGPTGESAALFGAEDQLTTAMIALSPPLAQLSGHDEDWHTLHAVFPPALWVENETPWGDLLAEPSPAEPPPSRYSLHLR